MVQTRSGKKRELSAALATRDEPVVSAATKTKRQRRAPPAAATIAAAPATTLAVQNKPIAKRGRRLNVARYWPINIRQVHQVHSLYVFRAFDLRAVAEQVHQHSTSLVRLKVANRLQFIKDFLKYDNHVDDRWIRRVTRHMQEILGYLEHYMTFDDQHQQHQGLVVDYNNNVQTDVYTSGLEAIIAILQASEHFRQTLLEKGGWTILLQLLGRHDVRLRSLICQILTTCFATVPKTSDKQLSASDRDWNYKYVARIASNNCPLVLFHSNNERWGMNATRWTVKLMVPFTLTVAAMREAGHPYAQLVIDTLGPLSERYLEHAESILVKVQALDAILDTLIAEREVLSDDVGRLEGQRQKIMSSQPVEDALMDQYRNDKSDIIARLDSLVARTEKLKADMALLR